METEAMAFKEVEIDKILCPFKKMEVIKLREQIAIRKEYTENVLAEHDRTQDMLKSCRNKVRGVYLMVKGTRNNINLILQEAQDAEDSYTKSLQALKADMQRRKEMEDFLRVYNAGKPLGYFKVPSFMYNADNVPQGPDWKYTFKPEILSQVAAPLSVRSNPIENAATLAQLKTMYAFGSAMSR